MQEMLVQSLGQEDPLEEEMATNSIILAWESPMDRGAWWATVQEVTKSQTQLSTNKKEIGIRISDRFKRYNKNRTEQTWKSLSFCS